MRRFLTGLSSDELRFIAAHLGFRILDPSVRPRPWIAPPPRIVPDGCAGAARAIYRSHDLEHKMILLMEFLGRSGMRSAPQLTPAARWN
jgi:hypothetical protein